MTKKEANIYSVSQVTGYIKGLIEQEPLLQRIHVKGEVSNCTYASSGHVYFTLKDREAVISCAMWRSSRKNLKFPMKNGDQVIVCGDIGVYGPQGRYQLYAREIRLEGEGYYHQEFERVKKKLGEEGLFDPGYKQPIPRFIRSLGVVTAPTGAVIDDIRTTARRRNPYVQIYLCPAQVQGEGAVESLIRGLRMLDTYGVDTIIIGRGGGSMEDLWAFNSEALGRAIFSCHTPVISAVGHAPYEQTISDLAADASEITPTAAAERAVFSAEDFLKGLQELHLKADSRMSSRVELSRHQVRSYEKILESRSPGHLIDEKRQRLEDFSQRLEQQLRSGILQNRLQLSRIKDRLDTSAETSLKDTQSRTLGVKNRLQYQMDGSLRDWKTRMAVCAQKMDSVSPLRQMGRGFVFVSDDTGAGVRSVRDMETGQPLRLHMIDGKADVRVERILPDDKAPLQQSLQEHTEEGTD